MQLFGATSTALGFLHRTETANSPLETQWGESASPELLQFLEKNSQNLRRGMGRTCPASIHHPNQNQEQKCQSPTGMCSGVAAQSQGHALPSQSQTQPAALRNAPKIFQGLSQSLPLGAELLSKFLTHLSWPSSHWVCDGN